MRELFIITGPPGSGKEEYAEKLGHPIYATAKKSMWRDSPVTCTLITAAPGVDQKEFWSAEGRRFGFLPQVVVLDPGKGPSIARLVKREIAAGAVVSDRRRARLAKTVARWHSAYSDHPEQTHASI